MKRTYKIVKSAFVAVVTITLSASCGAQDAGSNRFQPHFSGQAPGEAQSILRQFKGSVIAVDPKAKTLTVKLAKGNRVFTVTDKTKFSCGDKPALLKDIGVGKAVEVVVNIRAQSDEAITVNIIANNKKDAGSTPGG